MIARSRFALIETLAHDLRYGVRSLIRTPWFTAAAVTALALGIGATSAILSVVHGVLLQPLAYDHPDRLVTVLYKGRNPVAPANFLDWQREARSFQRLGAAESWSATLTGVTDPEKLDALRLTADVLPLLGVPPVLGRAWTADDDETGHDHVVVLSHELWVRRFGADSSVIGRRLLLNGEAYAVVAVMPEHFAFAPFWATHAELWAPLALHQRATDRDGGSLRVFGRLAAGVSLAQARAEMATITGRLEHEFPHTNADMRVTDLTEQVVGDVRTPLLVILGAVAFVLMIACANVAHLLLARAAARQREVALRTALGASRRRIVRQFLTESALLAALGGVAGLLLARVGIRLLVVLGAASIPRAATIALDVRVVAATMVITLVTGILFGLAPAIVGSATDLAGALKGGRGASEGGRRSRTRDALIASECALALMLLIGAGLLIRSFVALQALDPGYDPRNLLTMVIPVTGTSESVPGRRLAFYQDVLSRVRAIPGVQSVGAVNHIPIGGDEWGWPFRVQGAPEPKNGEAPVASYKVMMPGYFQAMGIPIVAGRDVSPSDRLGTPGVVVVNEYLARRYWPGETALGKRVSFDRDSLRQPVWLTVVGVVRNTIHGTWGEPAEEEAWLPLLQHREYLTNPSSHFAYLSLVVRVGCPTGVARCDAVALMPAIRAAIHGLDPDIPVAEVQTMESIVEQATARQRFYLVLLGAFAGVALVLAAVGIYGVMTYSVSRRTHEIGVRVALGARPAQLLGQIVGEGMRVAALGGLAGVLGALALSRAVSTLLFEVRATDLATFSVAVLLLAGVAAGACYVPARRAMRVDPVDALRAD